MPQVSFFKWGKFRVLSGTGQNELELIGAYLPKWGKFKIKQVGHERNLKLIHLNMPHPPSFCVGQVHNI